MKIYLINTDSYLLANEKINDIIKDNKNVLSLNYNDTTITDIILEAGYVSMFLEEKYIVIKNANFFGSGKLNESDTKLLLNYLKEPNSLTVLIFVCSEKIDLRKKITKTIKEQYSLEIIPPLKVYEIETKIKDYLAKKNYQISKEGLKYIINNSLNNYDIAMNETNKLLLFYDKPCFIKDSDIAKIISRSLNTNNFLLVDAIVNGDLEKSLKLYNDLKIMKIDPSVILSLLARDFRIMLNVKTMQEQNKREYEILNSLSLMDWQLENYLKKIYPYKLKELETILVDLADIDLNIKSGLKDKFLALELFILKLCA